MDKLIENNNALSNIKIKQLLSQDEHNNDLENNLETSDYYYFISNNDDTTLKSYLAPNYDNKSRKNLSKKIHLYIIYFIKMLFVIIFFLFIISKIVNNEINLNNYLDKIYGEEDLLIIIKEKEKEMNNCSSKRRNEIEKEIENIYDIIEKIKLKKKEIINNNKKIIKDNGKLILSCSYSLNNEYIYPTLVSMTSLVINAGNNTFYNIYVLISPDFSQENKNILMSIEQNYTEHCKIYIINMGDKYQGKDTNDKIPIATYYRLDLQNILPDVDRIIYMDGDTAVFKDLSELIFYNMKDNYILGFLDNRPKSLKKYNINNAVVLCAGVLLMDLNAMRRDKISEKFNEFLNDNLGKLDQHDQTTINVVCQGKISTLPPKYGLWNFETFQNFKNHINAHYSWIKYNKKECQLAYENPAIIHYVMEKPFKKCIIKYYYYEWWEYANKTGYYDEIYKYANNEL